MSWLDDLDSTPDGDKSDPRSGPGIPSDMLGAIANMKPVARALKGLYDSFVEAGFTTDQSFALTTHFLINTQGDRS